MQACPNCSKENMEGVVFCQHCGVALVPVPLSTRQFSEEDRAGTGTLPDDGVVMLHIDGEEMPHTIQLREYLILGRFSEPSNDANTTYFDLTPYGAEDKGVSRQHAKLRRESSQKNLYMIDQNSTNGTKINGEILPPAVEKQVRDGDELTLGRLKMFVYFRQ